jgi:cellulose biosynthesis protein BcsQ
MRIITLVTQKGGTGKSTLTTSLAVAAVQAGEKVIAFDLDQQGTLTAWAHIRQQPAPAIAQLPARESGRLAEVLATAAKSYTVALVDTPGADSPMTHNAMTAADLCLVPLRPTRPDGLAVKRTVEALIRGKKRFAFVLNQCPNDAPQLAIERDGGRAIVARLSGSTASVPTDGLSGRLCGRAGGNRIRPGQQSRRRNAPALGLD